MLKILFFGFLMMYFLPVQADFASAEEAYRNRRYSEAFNKFLPEAEKGDYLSQYYVGYLYLNGLGVNKDESKALKYLQKAADKSDSAQALLAYLYDEGRVVPVDKKKAVALYKKAADSGNTSALLNLGLAYYKGEGVSKNNQMAIDMLEKVPLEERPEVGRYLGDIYLSSNQYQKAVNAYASSAKNKDIESYYSLARIYSDEKSGMKSDKKALDFYTYAASEGYIPAQYLLGTMYINETGVEKNMFLGRAWLEMAAAQRYEPALTALEQLDMTLSEVEESRKEFMRLQQEVLGKLESPFIVEQREMEKQNAAEKEKPSRNRYRRR